MNSTWKAIAIAGVSAVLAVAILVAGFYLGRSTVSAAPWEGDNSTYWGGMMMGLRGMMGSGPRGPWTPDGFSASGHPMGGMMGWQGSRLTEEVDPLSIEEAEEAASEYLSRYGYDDFAIEEVMVFDNHAYVQVAEPETGIGAMELLVDPVRAVAYPEYGPNMMWNLKYGHMAGTGGMMGMGGMMGAPARVNFEAFQNDLSAKQAVERAQAYLDRIDSGLTADDHADAFYGYYTIHTLGDGDVTGMLSVNGFTGEVYPHTWHGALVTMNDH